MAVQSKAEVEKKLIASAKRARLIREAAEKLKNTLQTEAGEAVPAIHSLIKATLSSPVK